MGRFCALNVLFVLAFAVATIVPTQAGPAFGSLFLNSLPNGADVWVDGNYIGRTPLLLDGLRAGKHSITVTKTGWKVEEVDPAVIPGITLMTSVQLEPVKIGSQRGSVALHGVSRGARARVDSGPWDVARAEYVLSAGSHKVSVKQQGRIEDRSVAVYPDQTTHLVFRAAVREEHSAVVAPLSDYVPDSATKIDRGRLVIRYQGHVVVGRVGDARFTVDKHDVTYDAPAGMVRGKLYVPLDLILSITGGKSR